MGGRSSRLKVIEDAGPKLPRDCREWRRRNESYKAELARAGEECLKRMEANACPKEKMGSFVIVGLVGAGGFGSVLKVQRRKHTATIYSLKVQAKTKFKTPSNIASVVFEKKVQYAMKFEFILPAHFCFQDKLNLYLGTSFAKHGDLSGLIEGEKMEETTLKYVAGQIILGVEYLHACDIIHRDLKAWNILVFDDLYVKITDFGISKRTAGRTYSHCGTRGYIAPEVSSQNGYGKAVDWWSLGLLLFELLYNEHPFIRPGYDYANIAFAVQWLPVEFPIGVDPHDTVNKFISSLLIKDPSLRLGGYGNGAENIKNHFWFVDISFFDILDKKIRFDGTLKPLEVTPCDYGNLFHIEPAPADDGFAEY